MDTIVRYSFLTLPCLLDSLSKEELIGYEVNFISTSFIEVFLK